MRQATDPSRFVQLLLRHQQDLLRHVLPLVGCLEDAQDVLQETALALWKKFAEYDPAQPFLPWARRFARNEVLMHHRKKRRYTFLSQELIESLADRGAELEGDEESRREALHGCVEALPGPDRVLLDRRYADPDATIQRLAEATRESVNVLYKALARIRRQLLECVSRKLSLVDAV